MDDSVKDEQPAGDEPIVAVFDTKTMALRTIAELRAATFGDLWLGVVSGETRAGETTVTTGDGDEELLHQVLAQRGAPEAHARRFDGILPPGTAVMALSVRLKREHAVWIIEHSGGHIEEV